jgi:hypothetical protein
LLPHWRITQSKSSTCKPGNLPVILPVLASRRASPIFPTSSAWSWLITRIWRLESAQQNFPMALDTRGHHLFVGTRRPAFLQVYDADSGNLVSQVAIGADPDDIFFDSVTKRLYVVCGEGVINVIRQTNANHFTMEMTVPTRAGARTGLFVPEEHRLYVAVPQRNAQSAEIREFAVSP